MLMLEPNVLMSRTEFWRRPSVSGGFSGNTRKRKSAFSRDAVPFC